MTTTPDSPAVPVPSPAPGPGSEVVQVDAVLTGRAMSSGAFLAGLIANAQLATVGSPSKLPADLFPDVDPVVVQRIWDRALAVGLHAGRVSANPRRYRDQMARLEEQFARVGYEAMVGTVARSRRLVAPDVPPHPADGETGRGH